MSRLIIALLLTVGPAAAMGGPAAAMGGPAAAMGGGAGGEGAGGSFSFFIPILLLIGVFYFLVLRPQQKKEKGRQGMLSAIKKGDRVLTAGGIRATVVKVYEQEKFVRVEIAKGVEVDVALGKIDAILPGDALKHPQKKTETADAEKKRR